jgi:hypothetical protein
VAVGSNGVVTRSADGLTWTAQTVGAAQAFVNVASLGANGFVAVLSGSSTLEWWSADGITWVPMQEAAAGLGVGSALLRYISVDETVYTVNSNVQLIARPAQRKSAFFMASTVRVSPTILLFTPNALDYDSTNDLILSVGQGSSLSIWSRTYDKATQFIVPDPGMGIPAWIKATA